MPMNHPRMIRCMSCSWMVKTAGEPLTNIKYATHFIEILYTPISKNVVGDNGEWQLSNENCTTERNCGFHIWYAKTMSSSRGAKLGSSSNHDDDGNRNPKNLHIWHWKTVFLHASFDILKTFSFFLWCEMTFFAVVWMTWAYDDKCSIMSRPKRWLQFNSRIVKAHILGIMTVVYASSVTHARWSECGSRPRVLVFGWLKRKV